MDAVVIPFRRNSKKAAKEKFSNTETCVQCGCVEGCHVHYDAQRGYEINGECKNNPDKYRVNKFEHAGIHCSFYDDGLWEY